MGTCIGTILVLLVFAAAARNKPVWKKIRSPCRILLLFGLLGLLAGAAERISPDAAASGQIRRNAPGEGDLETEACFSVRGKEEEFRIPLIVPERKYDVQEEKELLFAAAREIEETFCGTNASLKEIVSDPVAREHYQDGAVSAEWSFSNREAISEDGEICREALGGKKEEITAHVTLKCGKSEELVSFAFELAAAPESEKEKWTRVIQERILKQDESSEAVSLPETADGREIFWKSVQTHRPAEILALGAFAAVAAAYVRREKEERQKKKTRSKMLLSYPEFAGKLSLLLGAGMTIPAALRNMDRRYQRRISQGGRAEEVYEKLHEMICNLDNGMGEIKAFQAFSEQCGLQPYRKLASLLISGQKAGNRRLAEQLGEEADRVFLERKNAARRLGEEAGTKLLLPMMMMLVIVMAIVILPAFLAIYETG